MLLETPYEYKLVLFIFCSVTLTIILGYYKIQQRQINKANKISKDLKSNSKNKGICKKVHKK